MNVRLNFLLSLTVLGGIVCGCVKEDYDLSKVDSTVTIFQNGAAVPLAKTKKITMEDIMAKLDSGVIALGAKGYQLQYPGNVNLKDGLPDLKSYIPVIEDIDPMTSSFQYKLEGIEEGSFKIEAQNFQYKCNLKELYNIEDITDVEIDEQSTFYGGLDKYAAKIKGLSVDLLDHDYKVEPLFKTPTPEECGIGPEVPDDQEFTVPSEKFVISDIGKSATCTSVIETDIAIEDLKDVMLSSDSKMVVTIELDNCFLTNGSIVPELTLDISQIAAIEGSFSPVSLSSMTLTPSNGFSASKEYKLTELNMDSATIKDGTITFKAKHKVEGNFSVYNPTTTKAMLNSCDDVNLLVSIKFENVKIESANVVLGRIEVANEKTMDVPMSRIELPEMVSSVENVTFTSSSEIALDIASYNVPSGLELYLDSLVVEFPSCIEVEGATAGRLIYRNIDLTTPTTKTIKVLGINFPEPEQGVISITDKIKIKAGAYAQCPKGMYVNTESLPSSKEEDVTVVIDIAGTLKVEDIDAVLVMDESKFVVSREIVYELPEGVKDFGTFVIYPEGTPAIDIQMSAPNVAATGDGTTITLPDFLTIGDVPASPLYKFDHETNSLLFDAGSFPSDLDLPIAYLTFTPVVENEKYVVKGTVTANCYGAMPQSGHIDLAGIKALTEKDIVITVNIPEISAKTISLARLSIPVDKKSMSFKILSAGQCGENIKNIAEVGFEDDVLVDLSIEAKGLPVLAGEDFYKIALDIQFPSYLKVTGADKDNVVHIDEKFEDGAYKHQFTVTGMNLDGVDLGKDVYCDIVYEGSIYVDEPDIDIKTLKAEVNADIEVDVSSIVISEISANASLAVNKHINMVGFSGLPDYLKDEKVTLDFLRPYLLLNITTNTGVPLCGDIIISSVRDEVSVAEVKVPVNDIVPYTKDPADTLHNSVYLANSPISEFVGCQYMEADIRSLIRQIPDSLVIELDLKVDSTTLSYVQTDAEYEMYLDYNFVLPMEFGEDLYIPFRDTIKADGIGDLMNSALIGGRISADNMLPLNFNASLSFMDTLYRDIPSAYDMKGKIDACKEDGSMSHSSFEMYMQTKDKSQATSVKNLLLVIEVDSKGTCSKPITDEDYLQAEIVLLLPEGMTFKL